MVFFSSRRSLLTPETISMFLGSWRRNYSIRGSEGYKSQVQKGVVNRVYDREFFSRDLKSEVVMIKKQKLLAVSKTVFPNHTDFDVCEKALEVTVR